MFWGLQCCLLASAMHRERVASYPLAERSRSQRSRSQRTDCPNAGMRSCLLASAMHRERVASCPLAERSRSQRTLRLHTDCPNADFPLNSACWSQWNFDFGDVASLNPSVMIISLTSAFSLLASTPHSQRRRSQHTDCPNAVSDGFNPFVSLVN